MRRFRSPDWWVVFSYIAVAGINIGVFFQALSVFQTKDTTGFFLPSWIGFTIFLGYLAVFAHVKKQHPSIFINYFISMFLQGSITVLIILYRYILI